MKKIFGFSLIELVLSLGLISILLTVYLKLNAWEKHQEQAVLEEQNLMAYTDVLEWTLKNIKSRKTGVWSGFQDIKTKERKFIRGDIKDKICSANVQIPKGQDFYQVNLKGGTPQNAKITPITFFIIKE